MKHRFRQLALLAIGLMAALLLVTAVLLSQSNAAASSHREAPLIAKDQYADTTDTYVWIPAGQTENLVLAASWIPFEGPEGGPNYYAFDDTAMYDIFVDNDGDAIPEITYTLKSLTQIGNPNTFLYNTGPISSLDDPNWNQRQVYTLTENMEGTHTVLVDGEPTAPVNIGSKSTPDYEALMSAAVYEAMDGGDTIQVFAGQTDDPFWVDLQIFDLLTLRGQGTASTGNPIGYPNENNIPLDSLSGFNVHSIVIELPIDRLTQGDETVLGVWAGTRRMSMNVMGQTAAPTDAHTVQVSRLGMPLVNEAVLPLGLKDTFNSIPPSVDLTVYGVLQESVEDPELGNLLCALYGVPLPGDTDDDCATEYTAGTPRTGRGDIFDIFLTGMVLTDSFTIQTADGPFTLPAGFNVNQPAGVVPAEMIRINTAIAGDLCAPEPSRLGVLGGDGCGFPNGRRLADDVIEIELLAVAGAAYGVLDNRDGDFSFDPALIGVLDDGLDGNDVPFQDEFPYLAMPHSGENHYHENILKMYMPVVYNAAVSAQSAAEENPVAATAVTFGGIALFALPALVWFSRRNGEK
jgi:hypothetical protein